MSESIFLNVTFTSGGKIKCMNGNYEGTMMENKVKDEENEEKGNLKKVREWEYIFRSFSLL